MAVNSLTEQFIIQDSVLKIGNVVSVTGRTVRVKVDKTKNLSHLLFNGGVVKNISVGGYVKIRKGFEVMIGKIEGEFVDENHKLNLSSYNDKREKLERILELKLVGFYEKNRFKKGIKELPLLDNECFLINQEEYLDVHNFVDKDDFPLEIGSLANDSSVPILVGVNSLFASHIGIFGNTGSGKSYTLAKLYNRLIDAFKGNEKFHENARFYLLDFNGEYLSMGNHNEDYTITEPEFKKVIDLSTRNDDEEKYPLSFAEINDDVLWVIISEATEKTQTPFLRRALRNHNLETATTDNQLFAGIIEDTIVAMVLTHNKEFQSTIQNFLKDMIYCLGDSVTGLGDALDNIVENLGYHNNNKEYYIRTDNGTVWGNQGNFEQEVRNIFDGIAVNAVNMNIFRRIHAKILLKYYDEISKGYANRDHLGPMLKRLDKRVGDLRKVLKLKTGADTDESLLTIISMKNVNIHMRKALPLIICKQLYEEKKTADDKTKYLNIIIDEAHNILSEQSLRESEQWKDYRLETFEEIIKEGRKFGTFLTIASQRPYDISPTIVSQLHNYFLHRMINEKDLKAIENTVSFLDRVSFETLPIIPTGHCVLSGLVSQVPVIVAIAALEKKNEPKSETYRPTNFWQQ